MPHDLAEDLRPRTVVDSARRARRVRRIAPLATAVGVIIAATIGLVIVRIDVPVPSQPTVPSVGTTVPTTH